MIGATVKAVSANRSAIGRRALLTTILGVVSLVWAQMPTPLPAPYLPITAGGIDLRSDGGFLAKFGQSGDPEWVEDLSVDVRQFPTDVIVLADGSVLVLGIRSHEALVGDDSRAAYGFAEYFTADGHRLNGHDLGDSGNAPAQFLGA